MVDPFLCENARKWKKKHIYRKANKKQGTAVFLDVQVIPEGWQLPFSTVSKRKQDTVYVFSV